jgi:7,8-dihydropterin-6-yl-methyl-4-(beta-D-ribofuranosyl)aminobenzene 5'-phosphate synthase
MKVVVLSENSSSVPGLKKRHGLCLRVEARGRVILFDVGPDGSFIENASKLGVGIADAEAVVVSHGHVDHGGGLDAFLSANAEARVFIQRKAFLPHRATIAGFGIDVGLDSRLADSGRFALLDGGFEPYEGFRLFSLVPGMDLLPRSN